MHGAPCGDTLLPRSHARRRKRGGVSWRIRIRSAGGGVKVRWVAHARPDRPRQGRCGGQGLGQCGDELHLTPANRAFRHPSMRPTGKAGLLRPGIDTENPCKQASPGVAVDRSRRSGLLGVSASSGTSRALARYEPDLRHWAPTPHNSEQCSDEAEEQERRASRSSSGESTRCVVPSDHGVLRVKLMCQVRINPLQMGCQAL